jgi:hypothetical protein
VSRLRKHIFTFHLLHVKKFNKLCTFNVICKGNAAINCNSVKRKKTSIFINSDGSYYASLNIHTNTHASSYSEPGELAISILAVTLLRKLWAKCKPGLPYQAQAFLLVMQSLRFMKLSFINQAAWELLLKRFEYFNRLVIRIPGANESKPSLHLPSYLYDRGSVPRKGRGLFL